MMAMSPQKMWAWGGSGTPDNPYTIKNVSDLIKFANIVNGTEGETQNTAACAKLTANITFVTGTDPYWTCMIGSSSKPYTGTFDGQGYKITNMRMSYRVEHAGMFAYVTDATIKNFSVEGSMSSNKELTGDGAGIGTIVGRAEGATKILDVASSIGLAVYYEKQKHIGGILGYMGGSTQVSGCTYSGTLDVGPSNDSNGGIVGFATNSSSGSITNCMCTGTITSSTSGPTIGGILGYTNDESNNFGGVQNCFSSATLTITGSDKYANAIVGRIRSKSHTTINNTFLSGTATRACNEDCAEKVDFTKNYAISISVTAGSGGKVTTPYRNPTSTRAPQLQVKATPNNGYHFVSWSDNNAQNHYVALTSNVNLNATFGAHTYGDLVIEKNPTCTTTGSWYKQCTHSGCTAKQTGTTAATGHGNSRGYTPTYEWTGSTCSFALKCNDCNTVVTSYITGSALITITHPNCTKEGSRTYEAKVEYNVAGDKAFSEKPQHVITDPAKGHTYKTDFTIDVAATCTTAGSKKRVCDVCNEKETVTIAALGHDYSEFTIDVAATCTTNGSKLRTCSRCEDRNTVSIAALGHKITKHAHTEPTCTTQGYDTYYECSTCSHTFSDEQGKNEIDVTYVPALGHDFADYMNCSRCNVPMPKTILDVSKYPYQISIYSNYYTAGSEKVNYDGSLVVTGTSKNQSNLIYIMSNSEDGKIILQDLDLTTEETCLTSAVSDGAAKIDILGDVKLTSSQAAVSWKSFDIVGSGNLSMIGTGTGPLITSDLTVNISGDLSVQTAGATIFDPEKPRIFDVSANNITIKASGTGQPFMSDRENVKLHAVSNIVMEGADASYANDPFNDKLWLYDTSKLISDKGIITFLMAKGTAHEYVALLPRVREAPAISEGNTAVAAYTAYVVKNGSKTWFANADDAAANSGPIHIVSVNDDGDKEAIIERNSSESLNVKEEVEVTKATIVTKVNADVPMTLMLPFDVVARNIGSGTAYIFNGVYKDYDNDETAVDMVSVIPGDVIPAYKPFVFIPDCDTPQMIINGPLTLKETTPANKADIVNVVRNYGSWSMKGTYDNNRWDPSDPEYINIYKIAEQAHDDINPCDWINLAENTSMYPMRAYIKRETIELGARPYILKVHFIDSLATRIGTLNTKTGEMTVESKYNLNGQRITTPRKGEIYIQNGKKRH